MSPQNLALLSALSERKDVVQWIKELAVEMDPTIRAVLTSIAYEINMGTHLADASQKAWPDDAPTRKRDPISLRGQVYGND